LFVLAVTVTVTRDDTLTALEVFDVVLCFFLPSPLSSYPSWLPLAKRMLLNMTLFFFLISPTSVLAWLLVDAPPLVRVPSSSFWSNDFVTFSLGLRRTRQWSKGKEKQVPHWPHARSEPASPWISSVMRALIDDPMSYVFYFLLFVLCVFASRQRSIIHAGPSPSEEEDG
jgi:hypothetical protein